MSSPAPKSPLTKVTRLAVGLLLIAVVGLGYLATSAGAAGRDRDGDGMPNRWEVNHGLNANRANARGDKDHDGLRNLGEFRHHTDPTDVDSDDDGSDDTDEVRHHGTDPTDADSDDDGILDGNEDSDDDGIDDEDEDDADEVSATTPPRPSTTATTRTTVSATRTTTTTAAPAAVTTTAPSTTPPPRPWPSPATTTAATTPTTTAPSTTPPRPPCESHGADDCTAEVPVPALAGGRPSTSDRRPEATDPPARVGGRRAQSSTVPRTLVVVAPPTQMVPSASCSTSTSPWRPRTVPWRER